jgi:transforming growth factor-beta-induced protein
VEIICSREDLDVAFCSAIKFAGLEDTLSEGNWTVFVPTNEAFLVLPPNLISSLYQDSDKMSNLVLFHAVHDEILFQMDLSCEAGDASLLGMANGENSRTLCDIDYIPAFQKGAGNSVDDVPRIIEADIDACNGVIQIVNKVLLPENFP